MEAIAGYNIKQTLGTGGMASVYLGIQESLGREVAIKVLDVALVDDKIIHVQFERESKLIAKLNHPNIVQVIDQGISAQGHPYFVMPYVKSVTLAAILKRNDVAITRKLDIAIQICKALAYAHRNGVVHRDIKPENILVDYDGHVRIVDFGIAGYFVSNQKASNTDISKLVMGTPGYMAPELNNGANKANNLSDIYSFGVVLYQLFFGSAHAQSKTQGTNDQQTLLTQLKPLIQSCIENEPENRPDSSDTIRQTLLLIAQGKHLHKNQWNASEQQDTMQADYKLLDVLKENPFGATYLVKSPKNNRILVIKKQRIEHIGEAQSTNTKLTHTQHPHIMRIFGTAKNARSFITVSEYLVAGSLQDRLTQALTLGQWTLMAQQIFSALAYAHGHGIIHGNIRPSNILFESSNFIKLTDFGFPPHNYDETDTWYRVENEALSFHSDIYAAGAILFQLLSGELPASSFLNWKNYWRLRKIPKKLRSILLRLTQENINKRCPTAELAFKEFQQLYEHQGTQMSERIVVQHN